MGMYGEGNKNVGIYNKGNYGNHTSQTAFFAD